MSLKDAIKELKQNPMYSEETKEIIIRGLNNGIGVPLKNDKHNFVFVVNKDLFEKGRVPDVPDGEKPIISCEKDCQKMKTRIKKEKISEEKRMIERMLKGDTYAM